MNARLSGKAHCRKSLAHKRLMEVGRFAHMESHSIFKATREWLKFTEISQTVHTKANGTCISKSVSRSLPWNSTPYVQSLRCRSCVCMCLVEQSVAISAETETHFLDQMWRNVSFHFSLRCATNNHNLDYADAGTGSFMPLVQTNEPCAKHCAGSLEMQTARSG